MANWQRHLNIKDDWALASKREITAQELAARIANKLKNLMPLKDFPKIEHEKEELIEEMLEFSEDITANFDDFDNIMERLYDWADTVIDNRWPTKKACWIATNF